MGNLNFAETEMAIQCLSQTRDLNSDDLIALYSSRLGTDANAALSTLLSWLQEQLTASGSFATQYASPNATDFSVLVSPVTNGANVYLLMTPLAEYAAGTITLPALATCEDGQEVQVSSTQAVTALTVAGNGSTVNGAPTSLSANGFFKLRFDGINQSWYRIG